MKNATVITGASTGIGFDTAVMLATRGHQVFAGVRRDEDAQKLRSAHANITPLIMDVTNEAQLTNAFETVSGAVEADTIVHLVNNAGIAVTAPIEGIKLEELRHQFETNVFGLVQATQIFSPLIRKNHGRIVMIGSISGLVSIPFLGAYSASKFALEAITTSLRIEMEAFGVKVCMIRPGRIATPIWEKNFDTESKVLESFLPEIRKRYEPLLRRFVEEIRADVGSAVPSSRVAEAIWTCVSAANPPAYTMVTTPLMKAQMALTKVLPAFLSDSALKKKYLPT